MIILDEADDPHIQSKVASETTLTSRVVRSTTPTPSLPDYESSQTSSSTSSSASTSSHTPLNANVESLEPPNNRWWPKHRAARIRRVVVYALVIYFLLTVAIGAPIIIIKLRHRYKRQFVSQESAASEPPTNIYIFDGEAPLLLASAVSCNAWTETDVPYSNMKRSELQYVIPLSGPVFLQSNISYFEKFDLSQQVSGILDVDFADDPTVTDAVVYVAMMYSDISIRTSTSVCLMNISGSNGLYLYTPRIVRSPDVLTFNISLRLPQTPSLYIPNLVTMLPRITQQYGQLASRMTFGDVEIGGPLSEVRVNSLYANTAVVKSPLAEISGQFNITQALVLDTVSAPINATISLSNNGGLNQVTFLKLSTGNSPLTANITLYLPPGAGTPHKAPNFLARAETFNAPLNLTIMHAESSAPAALQLHAENALGEVQVCLDSKFAGSFDVSTTYATAQVLLSNMVNGNVTDDIGLYTPSSSAAAPSSSETRTVDFDLISDSRMLGWVGFGARPSSVSKHKSNGQGRIEVESTLSPVTVLLGS